MSSLSFTKFDILSNTCLKTFLAGILLNIKQPKQNKQKLRIWTISLGKPLLGKMSYYTLIF